jgi:nitrite reductase/ring-hydroxylating ferredoxin subunit
MTEKTRKFQTVAKVGDLQPGEMMYVDVGDEFVCLINMDGEIHAINDTCTHEDASLSDGTIIGDEIECPLHGGAFDIRTGAPTNFPVVVAVETYGVRIDGDDIQIEVPT